MEAAPIKKTEGNKMDVSEMRMLRWMSGMTRMDKVRNIHVRGPVKVTEASKKAQGTRLRWFGHVMKRGADEEHAGRQVMTIEVQGRRIGRPKRRRREHRRRLEE